MYMFIVFILMAPGVVMVALYSIKSTHPPNIPSEHDSYWDGDRGGDLGKYFELRGIKFE